MSIWRHQKFDPNADYVVLKPLLFGGREFKRDELFDAKTSDRQRRILYDARFLKLAPANLIQQLHSNGDLILSESEIEELNLLMEQHGAADEPPDDQSSEPELEPEPEPEPEPETEAEQKDESILITRRVVPAGRGWYNVEEGEPGCGNFVNDKKLRLKDAQKLLTQ